MYRRKFHKEKDKDDRDKEKYNGQEKVLQPEKEEKVLCEDPDIQESNGGWSQQNAVFRLVEYKDGKDEKIE